MYGCGRVRFLIELFYDGEAPMIKYTSDHEWVRVDGDIGTVGITPFAQEKLGDLVFVELPKVGARVDKGETACTVESVKAAADVFAPAGGEIVAVNEGVAAEPGLVNASPMDEGWLFKVRIANPKDLDGMMDEAAYRAIEK
jgi:glycine cleavage system H protein